MKSRVAWVLPECRLNPQSSVVGYLTKSSEPAFWYQYTCQFKGTDNQNASLNGLISSTDFTLEANKPADADDMDTWTTCPRIQIKETEGPNKGLPTEYYWAKNGYAANGVDQYPGWINDQGDLIDRTVAPDQGFWFRHDGAANAAMTIAGQVASESAYTLEGEFWAIKSLPVPTAICPNDPRLTWTGFGATAADADDMDTWTTCPRIQIKETEGPNKGLPTEYYWAKNGYAANGVDQYPGWINDQGDLIDRTIDPGQAFWIRCENEFSVSFTLTK